MIIHSKKSSKTRKIAYIVAGLIVGFYVVTIAMQMINGKGDYIDTATDFAFFLGFAIFVFLIFPSEHFEFNSDEISFRPMADYRRRTVKLADIDYIHYESNRILLETKAGKRFEIGLSSFSYDEIQEIKSQVKSLNIHELVDEG
jgi:Zn-dependent protease with chaperone function